MVKRIKRTGPAITTREEMEHLVGEICELTIFIDRTKTLMDQRLLEVRAEYEDQLAGADKDLQGMMALAQEWAEEHTADFGVKKSIEMVHGTVGFRTGQPTLRTIAGWTWKRVMEVLSPKYIRTKREPDKEKLLADRNSIGELGLRTIGLRVAQDESFFVEPKREQQEPARQTA
jgi:phage host-nuclease inhibitor protein Gam